MSRSHASAPVNHLAFYLKPLLFVDASYVLVIGRQWVPTKALVVNLVNKPWIVKVRMAIFSFVAWYTYRKTRMAATDRTAESFKEDSTTNLG